MNPSMSSPLEKSSQIQQLLARLPAGLWLLDDGLRFTFCTGGAFEAAGLTTESLQGRHIDDVLGTTDPEHPAVRAHREALEGKTSSYLLDWQGRHFRSRVTPLRDDSGVIVGVAGLAIEDTERVLAEEDLRKAKQRFELVSRATSDIVWDWDLETGEVWRGRGSNRLTGCLRESRPSRELWTSSIHPDDRERVHRSVLDAIDSADEFWRERYRLSCTDGTNLHVIDRAYIIRDSSGKATRMVGAMSDVTSQRQHEVSEQWFRTLIENASDGLVVLNDEGRVLYQSPRIFDILGYEPSDLVGTDPFTHVHPEDRRIVEEHLNAVREGRPSSVPIELRYRHKDGTWRFIEVNPTLALDPEGEKITIANYRDISETKRLQRQVEASERLDALGRVATSMAHEFNNVLMGIQPFVEVIERTSQPEQMAAALDHIRTSIRRGRGVTDQVLQFTRAQQSSFEPIPAASWLHDQIEELRAKLPAGIHLESRLPDEEIWVMGNLQQLRQTLANLVSNALEAMEEEGDRLTITAETSRQGSWNFGYVAQHQKMLHLSVADTGIGIGEELQQRIFEPLFTTRKGKSTGLGLTLTKQIVAAHGGQLFVESKPGEGATFHLFLPVCASPVPAEPAEESRLDPRIRRILLIEDEATINEGLQVLFEMVGVRLEWSATGTEGIARFQSERPDAVILDIGLPDMEGATVFAALRRIDGKIPIVVMTGHAEENELENLGGEPRACLVRKPAELENLITALNAALGA
jgi:PAS domain S-box-containing protein